MGTLCYTLIESESDIRDFDCGNASINRLVANSVFPCILKQSQTYKMTIQGKCVGFFSVSICGVSLENSDAPIASYYDGTPSFGAVKVDFIAVDKKAQKHGIGSTALKYIVKEARVLSTQWPVRVLILDALRDVVDWYMDRGFSPVNTGDLEGFSPSVRLYIDLITKEEQTKLDQYIENSITY